MTWPPFSSRSYVTCAEQIAGMSNRPSARLFIRASLLRRLRLDAEKRPPDMVVREALGIHRRQAGRVHWDQGGRNRCVSRQRRDDALGRQNPLPLRLYAATDQLLNAERHLPFRREHEKVRRFRAGTLHFDNRGQTLVVVPRAAVPNFGFEV